MLKEPFCLSTSFPTNKQESIAYAEELVDGIKLWVKIDAVIVSLVILLWTFDVIPVILLGLAIIFAVGCPIVMTLGFSIGCLKYLEPKEYYEIVKIRLAT